MNSKVAFGEGVCRPDNGVSVQRDGMDDREYIEALELSNKVLNSENRRLVELLQGYQSLLDQLQQIKLR